MKREVQLSTINIPIALSVRRLEEMLNEQLNGVLFKDEIEQVNDLFVEVRKVDSIRLKMQGQSIQYQIPLNIDVVKKTLFGKIKGEGSVKLLFNTDFEIASDWDLATKTDLKNMDWIERPVLKVAGMEVPIQTILEGLLRRMKDRIETMIDTQIKERVALQKQVNHLWKIIQRPVLMSKEYRAWLLIRPKSIGMSPLITENNRVESTIHVSAFSEIFVGKKPAFESNENLPTLDISTIEKDEFNLSVKTGVSYQEATKQVNQALKGKSFTQAGHTVQVEGTNISGEDEKLIIKAKLSGDFNGTVVLEGKPYLDETTNKIEVEDLEFQVKTQNVIQKSAAWLFENKIVELIKKSLSFPIDEKIEEVLKIANQRLDGEKIGENFVLNGKIQSLDIVDSYLSERGITVLLSGTGRLGVAFV